MSKRSLLALTPNICLPASDGPIGSGPCNDAVVAVAENRSEQYQVESSSVFIYQYDALPPSLLSSISGFSAAAPFGMENVTGNGGGARIGLVKRGARRPGKRKKHLQTTVLQI